jgi:hypothetical protein
VNLYERAKADNKKILNRGFSADFEINNGKTGDDYAAEPDKIKGFYTHTAIDFNANGQMFIGNRISVSFHLGDFTIADDGETFEGWKLSFTNNAGNKLVGSFKEPLVDRTLNMLTTTVTLDRVRS